MGTWCQPTEPHEHLWPWEGRHGRSWWRLAADRGAVGAQRRWKSAPAAPPAPFTHVRASHGTPASRDAQGALLFRSLHETRGRALRWFCPRSPSFAVYAVRTGTGSWGGSRGPCVELGGRRASGAGRNQELPAPCGRSPPRDVVVGNVAQVRSPLRNRCPEDFLCF